MQLGVDNGIQNLILGRLNLDLTNPKQIQQLSKKQYKDALTALLGASSAIGKNTSAVETILDRIFNEVKNNSEKNSKKTRKSKAKLGSPKPHGDFPGYVLGNKGPVPAGTKKYENYNIVSLGS